MRIKDRFTMNRREMLRLLGLSGAASCLCAFRLLAETPAEKTKLRYALASSLFGTEPIEEILSVTKTTGAQWIDLWPLKHGNQREQVSEMGTEKFVELLKKYDIKLGLTTRFDLGPFGLKDEMKFVSDLGGAMIVTGANGTKGLRGDELKKAVERFHEQLKPHVEEAEKHEVVIAIENHSNMLLDSPDAVRYFVDGIRTKHLGIAFAPYHLPQNSVLLAELIRHCGSKLALFYAWQHGKGCMNKLPKEEELEQLPGRGSLDFTPLLAALKTINFQGFTEVFMHPFPRGISILENVQKSVVEIRRSMEYLESRYP